MTAIIIFIANKPLFYADMNVNIVKEYAWQFHYNFEVAFGLFHEDIAWCL